MSEGKSSGSSGGIASMLIPKPSIAIVTFWQGIVEIATRAGYVVRCIPLCYHSSPITAVSCVRVSLALFRQSINLQYYYIS